MATRPKLTLDEQSFQGLLAAAFTIQEHNDRRRAATAEAAKPAHVRKDSCDSCGASVPQDASSCPACGAGKFRPGERLQRNWASLWIMSQEQSLWPEPGDSAPEPGPNGNGRLVADREIATASSHTVSTPALRIQEAAQNDVRVNASAEAVSVESSEHMSQDKIGCRGASLPDSAPEGTSTALANAEDEELDPHSSEPVVNELAPRSEETDADTAPELWHHHIRLRFRRADLYLGLAVLVAALALFWPTKASSPNSLPFWERTLIAMGIAEAPLPPAHYHGDPNLQVWIDTHTALYYCPGDELYGKSPDGHYTTQHEAQADRYEPAERSACIQ